jgi:DNA-binding GntR family transcriptional regulator
LKEELRMEFSMSGNLAEQVSEYISEKIVRLELKPGQRIIESKIMDELGVSRSPIREALRILEGSRMVELTPRRGARVTEISASNIEWLYEVLGELYGLVARKAVENGSKEDLLKIQEALKKIEDSAEKGDVKGYFNGIFQFAAAGMKAAKNPLLEQIITDLWPITRRIQFATLSLRIDALRKNVKYFQLGTRYLEKDDAEMAAQTIRNYAQNEKKFALIAAKEGLI